MPYKPMEDNNMDNGNYTNINMDTNCLLQVGTISEAAEIWKKKKGSLIQTVKRKGGRFVEGKDWKMSGNTIIINFDSMYRIYGHPDNSKTLKCGISAEGLEQKFGIRQLETESISFGDNFSSKAIINRITYMHKEYGKIVKVNNIWFQVYAGNQINGYIDNDTNLYGKSGKPKQSDVNTLIKNHGMRS